MSGPQNAVMGDDSFGTELPQTVVPEEALNTETNMAKFSQSKEYQVLKAHIDSRIEYYQSFLPGNIAPEGVTDNERGKYWAIANILIGEFRAITSSYEQAASIVKDKNGR